MRKSLAGALLFVVGTAFVSGFAPTADRTRTVTGTIVKIQASERMVAVALPDGSEARFVWSADTKIGGVLAPGAKVTIRYEVGADGRNIALQITVARS